MDLLEEDQTSVGSSNSGNLGLKFGRGNEKILTLDSIIDGGIEGSCNTPVPKIFFLVNF